MNCYSCDKELIWGGDHTYEECDMEGEGIVSNLSCLDCDSVVLVYTPSGEKDETTAN